MTEEDKHWIASLFHSLQTQVQGLDTRMQGLETRMTGMETRMQDLETRMLERIERSETNLLTAFHQWASPMEARIRSHSATLRALDLEIETNLAAIKARLDELEARRPKH